MIYQDQASIVYEDDVYVDKEWFQMNGKNRDRDPPKIKQYTETICQSLDIKD